MRQPILANTISLFYTSYSYPSKNLSITATSHSRSIQTRQNQTKQSIGNGDLPQNILLLPDTSILARLFHSLFILLTFYLDISSFPTHRISFIYRYASNYYGVYHLLAHWKLFSSLFCYWTGELGTAIHGIRI